MGSGIQELKQYVACPLLLSTPELREPLTLYLVVSNHAMSAALLRVRDAEQVPV